MQRYDALLAHPEVDGVWVKYKEVAPRISELKKEIGELNLELADTSLHVSDLEAQLAKIAHIAHNDGLDNLTEAEALKRICILSLAWRDRRV